MKSSANVTFEKTYRIDGNIFILQPAFKALLGCSAGKWGSRILHGKIRGASERPGLPNV